MMPYMPGCSVRSACKNTDLSGDYCTNWSLLSNTCSVKYGMYAEWRRAAPCTKRFVQYSV